MIVTTINENGSKGQPRRAAYEAERKRRMAKLRRDSAQRTLEVIERKFPNLKTTPK